MGTALDEEKGRGPGGESLEILVGRGRLKMGKEKEAREKRGGEIKN